VGQRGYYWLHVHAANTYGFDDVPYDERFAWAVNNTSKMLEVARDPVGTMSWWGEAEKPYQFLACCLEWPSLMVNTDRHESRIAVQKDGSCNGLQHLSAISKDQATAELVNLAPGDSPRDVYGVVAKETTSYLETLALDEEDEKVRHAWLSYGIDRKLAKRPVMTLPYGSTFFAVGDFILEAVMERLGIGSDHPFPATIKEATTWLKKPLWDSIRNTIPGARLTMDWLQGSVKAASKANLPVSWATPDGFHVVQSYMKDKRRRLHLKTTGTTISVWIRDTEDEIDPNKQRNGIAPNFVHSLDACHMRMYVNKADAAGIKAHVMIHDSYGTHAADVETMDRLIREAFIEMYEQDVTAPLLESLEEQGTPHEEPLEIGSFDIHQVAKSAYFFG
jgi:DNA-directed RNA polymerase